MITFCLIPNHFHLLVQQKSDNGISKFLRQVIDSYTRYFNTKYQRVGPLFQGTFKAVRIETNEQLVHVSRYIHLNPLTSYIVGEENIIKYSWSSMKDFISGNAKLVNSEIVLSNFKSANDYLKFVLDQAGYAKELAKIKHLAFDA